MYISIDFIADIEYSPGFEQGLFEFDGESINRLVNAKIESFGVIGTYIIYMDFDDKILYKYDYESGKTTIYDNSLTLYPSYIEMQK